MNVIAAPDVPRLLIAVFVEPSAPETCVVWRQWSEQTELPPGVTVVFVKPRGAGKSSSAQGPRQVGDTVVLECDEPPTSAVRVMAFLRFANAHLAFDRLLVTRSDCFVSAASVLDYLEQPAPLVGTEAPASAAATDALGTWCRDEGYLLRRETVALAAEWPGKIVHSESGRHLCDLLRCAGRAPELLAEFAVRASLATLAEARPGSVRPREAAVICPEDAPDGAALRRFFERADAVTSRSGAGLLQGGPYHDLRFVRRLVPTGASTQAIRAIVRRNHEPVDDFGALEDRLDTSEAVNAYVSARDAEVASRIAYEYAYLAGGPKPEWPYAYLMTHRPPRSMSAASATDGIRLSPRPTRYEEAERLVTFIFCVKNRTKRTRIALRSLLSPRLLAMADVMVIEDTSADLLDLSDLPYAERVVHYVVDTGLPWTRSGLLNFGARQATTPLIAACDADFLFSATFVEHADRVLRQVDFDRFLFAINCFETETHRHMNGVISRAAPYGYQWVFDRAQFLGVRGFDEGFVGWGHEDRELEMRLSLRYDLAPLKSYQIAPALRVLHLSHSVRTGNDRLTDNQRRRTELARSIRWVANPGPWGSFPLVERRRYEGGRMIREIDEAKAMVQAGLRRSEAESSRMAPSVAEQVRMRLAFAAGPTLDRVGGIWSRVQRRAGRERRRLVGQAKRD